jgi:hypothetical protein
VVDAGGGQDGLVTPWRGIGMTALAVVAGACVSAGGHPRVAIGSRHLHVVARVTATLPADDNVTEFRPIFRAAYRRACAGVTGARSQTRFLGPRRWLLVIRCATAPSRSVPGVLVTFVNVRVPDMLGPVFPQLQGVTNRLGLRLHVAERDAPGSAPTAVVRQWPRPGTIVPFGTTVRIVIAR